jgi:hypothetical protein
MTWDELERTYKDVYLPKNSLKEMVAALLLIIPDLQSVIDLGKYEAAIAMVTIAIRNPSTDQVLRILYAGGKYEIYMVDDDLNDVVRAKVELDEVKEIVAQYLPLLG